MKVYLSKEQRLLKRIAKGVGESEVLRQVFMECAKSVRLVEEKALLKTQKEYYSRRLD